MKRHPFRANGSEFADSSVSNVAVTFCQCLSPTVSELSTQDKNRQGVLVRHIQELAKKILTDLLVPCTLHWWAGVATIDRLLTVSLVVEKL